MSYFAEHVLSKYLTFSYTSEVHAVFILYGNGFEMQEMKALMVVLGKKKQNRSRKMYFTSYLRPCSVANMRLSQFD